ncbi:nitroreductase family protein [Vibrio sp. L5-1]|uniref:nitroreductase family protein n=1 Tax=Vibrio sp. L5-1 TaxID=2912254 RepID=UPI001F35DCAD|nr:nitroreductase family protein [Vibrio sp. L5-1]MCF7497152.1 nitroreductase family protein [Vibrio sp. L5-1]
MLKKLLKKISLIVYSKRLIRAILQISANYLADCKRYIKYSSSIKFDDDISKLEGRICVFYHALEKGLSLPNPRKGFGEQKTSDLIDFTVKYASFKKHNPALISTVSGVLEQYFTFNSGFVSEELEIKYKKQYQEKLKYKPSCIAGTTVVYKPKMSFDKYSEFSKARRSIREFTNKPIDRKEIEECIELAIFTPSVCNRQPWKAYIYQGNDDVQMALSVQHGNKGFCEKLQSLILVTCDRSKFWHALERNQAYIDGGMFSMSIVNALHAKGFGSCCLNLSLTSSQEIKLQKTLNIPFSEVPIMMITVSHYDNGAKVASSERMPLDMILGN